VVQMVENRGADKNGGQVRVWFCEEEIEQHAV